MQIIVKGRNKNEKTFNKLVCNVVSQMGYW